MLFEEAKSAEIIDGVLFVQKYNRFCQDVTQLYPEDFKEYFGEDRNEFHKEDEENFSLSQDRSSVDAYEHDVEDAVEDAEDYVEDTEDYVEDTEDYVEDTEDYVEDTEDYVEDTEDHVEELRVQSMESEQSCADRDQDHVSNRASRISWTLKQTAVLERQKLPKKYSKSPYLTGLGKPRPNHPEAKPPRPRHRRPVLPPKQDSTINNLLLAHLREVKGLQNRNVDLKRVNNELQSENRRLKNLLARHEKGQKHCSKIESDFQRDMKHRDYKMQALREKLWQSRAQTQAAEQLLKAKDEQLRKGKTTCSYLKRLVDVQDLKARDELTSKLQAEEERNKRAEERNRVLETNLMQATKRYHREIAAVKKKKEEEIDALKENLELLTNKLQVMEKRIADGNLYVHRRTTRPQKTYKITESLIKKIESRLTSTNEEESQDKHQRGKRHEARDRVK